MRTIYVFTGAIIAAATITVFTAGTMFGVKRGEDAYKWRYYYNAGQPWSADGFVGCKDGRTLIANIDARSITDPTKAHPYIVVPVGSCDGSTDAVETAIFSVLGNNTDLDNLSLSPPAERVELAPDIKVNP